MKFKNEILMLFLFFSIISYSQTGQKNFIDQAYIEVTGQFETEVIPNEIYVNIVLNENDKKGKTSIETQENQMIVALKKLNIDVNKSLSIQDFGGSFQKYFLVTDKVTKVKKYQLIVNDGKLLGEVFRSLTEINISDISIAKVSHSEIEKIRRETKINALKVAKEKASDYAMAIDQNIGNAIHIQELSTNNYSAIRGSNSNGYHVSNIPSGKENISNLNLQTIKLIAIVQVKFILK